MNFNDLFSNSSSFHYNDFNPESPPLDYQQDYYPPVNYDNEPRFSLDLDVNYNLSPRDQISKLFEAYLFDRVQNGKLLELRNGPHFNPNILNHNHESLLSIACKNSDYNMVMFLLERYADPNHDFGLSMVYASGCDDSRILDALVQIGDVNSYTIKGTPLCRATMAGNIQNVNTLLRNDAHVDLIDFSSKTAFYIACEYNQVAIARLLLRKGASPNFKDINGDSPIIISSRKNNVEIIKLLLEHKIDPNTTDRFGNTALITASEHGCIDAVRILLEYGKIRRWDISKLIDRNQKNYDGYTPLIKAIEGSHIEIVNLLLENGANPNIKTKLNRSPLYFAIILKNIPIVKLLKEYGAITTEPEYRFLIEENYSDDSEEILSIL